jgi:hypothetical protein
MSDVTDQTLPGREEFGPVGDGKTANLFKQCARLDSSTTRLDLIHSR